MTHDRIEPITGKAPTMVCPHCKAKAVSRAIREESTLVRTLYYRCTDITCGFTFASMLSVTHEISPPRVRNPKVNLPPSPFLRVPDEPAAAPALPPGTRLCMSPRLA